VMLTPLPSGYDHDRLEIQRVATHVLARARFVATGRFGLRVTPTGIGTPAFGPDGDILRISGDHVVRERQRDGVGRAETLSVAGRSLGELAAFVDVDVAEPLDVGQGTVPIGDVSAPISIQPEAFVSLLSWFRLGATVLDLVLPSVSEPSVIQLWPEHFDVGFDAAVALGRVNLGASAGDADHPEPYLYLGPWGVERPGDSRYWNAPFGARLPHAELRAAEHPVDAAAAFFRRGLQLLG